MRRHLLVALGVGLLVSSTALQAAAQSSKEREDDQRRAAKDDADRKKKQKDKDWKIGNAPLPNVKNAGPCPYVKVLYDASRYVELKDQKESAGAVGWTGEIENINSDCRYKADEPISVKMKVNFALGRGPQAAGDMHDYKYWVAVVAKGRDLVLAKEYFDLPVRFESGADRTAVSASVDTIQIPRAGKKITGEFFEVLVGFDVTPEMAAFNREGKRFRLNVTPAPVDTAANAQP